jgi:hypothetical protein
MKMLAHDALTQALRVYDIIERARLHIGTGHEAQLRAAVTEAAAIVVAEKAILRGVLAAQGQAAQALHLSQRPAVGVGVQPHEHLNAANDHLTTPETAVSPIA